MLDHVSKECICDHCDMKLSPSGHDCIKELKQRLADLKVAEKPKSGEGLEEILKLNMPKIYPEAIKSI